MDGWIRNRALLAAQYPQLSIQKIHASIDDPNFAIRQFHAGYRLFALGLQGLLLELPDDSVLTCRSGTAGGSP
jgi:hypothetical protein